MGCAGRPARPPPTTSRRAVAAAAPGGGDEAMKRVFWGLVGLGMGAALGVGVMRWASRAADRLAPQSLAEELVQTAANWRARLSGAGEARHAPDPRTRGPYHELHSDPAPVHRLLRRAEPPAGPLQPADPQRPD